MGRLLKGRGRKTVILIMLARFRFLISAWLVVGRRVSAEVYTHRRGEPSLTESRAV